MNIRSAVCCAFLCMAASASQLAQATERGGSIYPMGVENFAVGAMPPPGRYTLFYSTLYSANELRDDHGDRVPLDFRVKAAAATGRFIWVTDQQLLGGQLAAHAVVPLVDLDVRVAGNSQHKTGLGDIAFGPALGYHHSDKLHSIVALDIYAPTGAYNQANLASTGRNYWAVQPVYALTYADAGGLNADIKAMYTVNRRNPDTHYRSGQELIVDYAVGKGFGNGWIFGVGGYLYRQTTGDHVNGADVGNKGRAVAIGPNLGFNDGKGRLFTLKWQREFGVRNRASGDAVWLKVLLPF